MSAQATFVAASPSDLMWLDQSDLIAAIDENPDIRACLEKTAVIAQNVSPRARNTTVCASGYRTPDSS